MSDAQECRVTIGLPVYNGARYLQNAIDSIRAQTFEGWQLIIADNASTDETLTIARNAASEDERIHVLGSDQNLGAAWNYNRLVDSCDTEFFRWHAHDDILAPEYLERCLAELDQHPDAILAYPKTLIIDENSDVIGPHADNYHLTHSRPSQRLRYHLLSAQFECNAVFGIYRTDILKQTVKIGSYPASDFVLLGQTALMGRVREIPSELFCRRDHAETSIRANPKLSDLQSWFGPRERRKAQSRPAWIKLNRHLGLVWKMDFSMAEKLRCSLEILRWAKWFWRDLAGDYVPALNSDGRKRVLQGSVPITQASSISSPESAASS